jgi:hypothetical protein
MPKVKVAVSWHLVAAILSAIALYGEAATNVVPAAYKPYVAAVVVTANAWLHLVAHNAQPPS